MKKKEQKKCSMCFGFGMHRLGDHTAMGPMDAYDGMPTVPCPECGANYNDYSKKKKSNPRKPISKDTKTSKTFTKKELDKAFDDLKKKKLKRCL